jgi:hypothetical protein
MDQGSDAPVSEQTMPCLVKTCTTRLSSVEQAEAHLRSNHPETLQTREIAPVAARTGLNPKLPQNRSLSHRGPTWYECDQCAGQFQYLTKGGTCRDCKIKLGED